jgi:hypothetical protein
MFAVIMGDLDRDTREDKEQVLALLEELKSQFSDLTIISGACKSGIGYFVRERCIQNKNNPDLGFVEYDIKPWTRLNEARLAQVFMSRNPGLIEIGEIFHILTSGKKTGHIPDLINRVRKRGLPLAIHYPDGSIVKENYPEVGSDFLKHKQSIKSSDLKAQLE